MEPIEIKKRNHVLEISFDERSLKNKVEEFMNEIYDSWVDGEEFKRPPFLNVEKEKTCITWYGADDNPPEYYPLEAIIDKMLDADHFKNPKDDDSSDYALMCLEIFERDISACLEKIKKAKEGKEWSPDDDEKEKQIG